MVISALDTALSSLLAHQRAIQVLSENVANAQNPNYSRKIANFEPVLAGTQGGGVAIASIVRVVDEFLIQEKRIADGDAAVLDTISSYLNEITALYGTVNESTSLAAYTSDLAEKLQQFTETPNDPSAAADVVASAELLTSSIRRVQAQFRNLRTRADQEISETVNRVNTLLREIDTFNVDILRAQAIGERLGAHNDLLDRRDTAINDLSELIDVQVSRQGDGTVILTTVGGRLLLDIDSRPVSHEAGNELGPSLRYDPDAVRPTSTDTYVDGIFVGLERTERNDVTRELSTGKLTGLIELRDKILPNLGDQIDEYARVLRDEFNKLHNLGSGWPPASQFVGKSFVQEDGSGPVTSLAQAAGVAANLTGVLRITIARRGSSDQVGEVVSTATVDFDNGVFETGGGAGNRLSNLAKIVQALQGAQGDDGTDLTDYVNIGFDADGRLFIRAIDPINHGVIIQQPENLLRSTQLTGTTQTDVLAFSVGAAGSFEILDTQSNRVIGTVNVDATTNYAQLLERINEIDGIGGVIVGQRDTSNVAVGTDPTTVGPRFYLEVTHTDGRRIELRDVGTGTIAGTTLQITDTDATTVTGLRGSSSTRYALSRGYSTLTAILARLDQQRTVGEVTPPTGGNITLTVALASDPTNIANVLFDPTTDTLADVVNKINTGLGLSGGVASHTVNAVLVREDGWRIQIQSLHNDNDELIFTGDGANYLGLDSPRRPTERRGFSHNFGLNDFFAVRGDFSAGSFLDVAVDVKSDVNRVSIRKPYNDPVSGGGQALASGNSEIGNQIYEVFTQDRLFFRAVGNSTDRFYISNTEGRLQSLAEGIVSSVSTGIRGVSDSADFSTRRADEIQRRVESVSGVNLEEELLQLEQYTYAYNAARRVLETVAELYDRLLEIRF